MPIVEWCCQELLFASELALKGVIANHPKRWVRFFLKIVLQPFGGKLSQPSDKLGQKLAQLMTEPNDTRRRLTRFVFTEPLANCPIGRLESAFNKICAVRDLERKISKASKDRALITLTLLEQINEALGIGIIDEEEAKMLHEAELARQEVIAVDDFNDDELRRASGSRDGAVKLKKEAVANRDDLSIETV